jgi:hypothetical protein
MKAPFEYDHAAAVALCKKYSSDPGTLDALLARLNISVGPHTVIPSPWNGSPARPLLALHMVITMEGYGFPFHASHNDAELFNLSQSPFGKEARRIAAERKKFRDGLLYSILCCVACDISAAYGDPEDMGFNHDSIKDMAAWNELKDHARKLSQACRFTPAELASLPS